MKQRNIANTELKLSAITFGAWAVGGWMWGGTGKNDSVNAIKAAFEQGVTSIDTAPAYGMGLSEEIVGEAIRDIPRDRVQILTKYGLRWDTTQGQLFFKLPDENGREVSLHRYAGRDGIIKECENSLRRLKTDYIDLYQIHWPDPTTPVQETMEAVQELIRQGKVRYAGVCNHDAAQLAEAMKYANVVSDQVPFSMVKRGIQKELVPFALGTGRSIVVYSPLERGLLTGKITQGYDFGTGDHRATDLKFSGRTLDKINAFLAKLKPLAKSKKATLAQLVLSWTLEQPGITIALVGGRTPEQSVENAKAADIDLTAEEIAFITAELDLLELD
jgi:aryl-alcohol dehydrogenase-like predicted oxidoreductase